MTYEATGTGVKSTQRYPVRKYWCKY